MKFQRMMLLFVSFVVCNMCAAPGDLDTSFGGGSGYVTTDFSGGIDFSYAVVEQSDDKIIAVGSAVVGGSTRVALARYGVNGSLDTTYGTLGKTTTLVGTASLAYSAVLDSNGKVLVAGSATIAGKTKWLLARYTTAGVLDTTFAGGTGYATLDIGVSTTDIAYGVRLQSDGKIIVGGQGDNKFAVARYTTAGVLDTATFGTGGVTTTLVGANERVRHIEVQTNDYIVVAGQANNNFAVARYTDSGSLDTGGFNAAGAMPGTFNLNIGGTDFANAIHLQPDGKILVCGDARVSGRWRFSTLRLTTAGVLDTTTFGGGAGYVTTLVNGGSTSTYGAMDVVYDANDSKIIVAGEGGGDVGVVRYNLNGSLDTSFGSGGIVTTNVSGTDIGAAVLLQNCGNKIVVSGQANNNFVVLRYLNSMGGDVRGYVLNDVDSEGIENVSVNLIQGGTPVETTTDGDGFYQFQDRTAGAYTVEVDTSDAELAAYTPTTPTSVVVNVSDGDCNSVNFGFQEQLSISGSVFLDTDGDGNKGGSEVGIGGITVTLTKPDTSTEIYVTDDGSGALGVLGAYQFAAPDIAAGNTYTVSVNTAQAALSNYTPSGVTSRVIPIVAESAGNANFGFQEKGSINGIVFIDENGNAVHDPTEPGISGQTVTLTPSGGDSPVISAGDGTYIISGVDPGTYTVSMSTPTGFTPTTSLSQTVTLVSGGSGNANFGFEEQGSISGTVFRDTNGDAVQQPSEGGLSGVTLTLRDSSNTVLGTLTSSAPNGLYEFSNLDPDTYTVTMTVPSGFVATTVLTRTIVIASGGAGSGSFGLQETGVIEGTVFSDLNGDSIRQVGEPGISGVTVSATGLTDVVTAGDGSFLFPGVNPGTYTVSIDTTPGGFINTTATSVVVVVPEGGSANASFGFQETGSISGTAFNDLNADGSQGVGEPGLGGITITLTGDASDTKVTAANGSYQFDGLSAGGNYTVTVTPPSGFTATTLESQLVTVPAGGAGSANFGFVANGNITGSIFQDDNGDGIQQPTESGIGGISIELTLTSGGSVIGTTTSASNGSYSFNSFAAGDYTVTASTPTGFTPTTALSKFVNIPNSPVADFGFQPTGSIAGTVFNDLNADGIKGITEPGIPGITVTLGGAASATTTSGANGSYAFTGLSAGTYTVTFTKPSGFIETTTSPVSITLTAGGSGTANYGLKEEGSVSGIVFNDFNGDGVKQNSEPGIRNAIVTLKELPSLDLVSTATTDTTGFYSLDISTLPEGDDYLVEVAEISGFSPTTPRTSQFTAGPGLVTISFGFQQTGTIQGVIFDDTNASGIQNNGQGISGTTVQLYNETGTTLLDSVITNAQGQYTFSRELGSEPSFYVVRSVTPTCFAPTTVTTQPSCLNPDVGISSVNYGKKEQNVITGTVFTDRNGDGVQQIGEVGEAGIPINLYNFAGNKVARTTTNSQGIYRFTNIPIGRYTVEVDPPRDEGSFIGGTTRVIYLGEGNTTAANFGKLRKSTVSGIVFNDHNGDGIQQDDEQGVASVTVTLKNSSGQTLSSQTTPANGFYVFRDLTPGSYIVEISNYPGYALVTGTTATRSITIRSDQSTFENFGLQRPNQIQGTVFFDLNANTQQGLIERAKQGAVVTLYDSQGTQIGQPQAVPGAGQYEFDNVPAGDYSVVLTRPTRCAPVSELTQSVTVPSGGAGAANYGLQMDGSISGVAFYDDNRCSTQEFRDPGVGDVTITIRKTDGSVTATTQTSVGDGSYLFTNLSYGTYTITAILPSGFIATTPTQTTVVLSDGIAGNLNVGCVKKDYVKSKFATAIQRRYCTLGSAICTG